MSEMNQNKSNPELLERIHQMHKDYNDETISAVINAVLDAELITPVVVKQSADGTVDIHESMMFEAVSNDEDKTYIVAFTDWDVLHQWKSETDQKSVLFRFEEYAAMLTHENCGFDGFVINPFTENLVFDKQLIFAIMNECASSTADVEPKTIPKDSVIQITLPEHDVTAMQDAISTVLQKDARVNSAYLLWMIREGEESYLVMIDALDAHHEIFQDIANAARSCLSETEVMDFISCSEAIAKDAMEKFDPFYIRSKEQ